MSSAIAPFCKSCGSDNSSRAKFCPSCGIPLVLVAGKYQMIKKLDAGGMGEIFLAVHAHLGDDIKRVIKLIRQKEIQKNHELSKRFFREVLITARLAQSNEHIVKIYDDFGEDELLGLFYVMEFLEGKALSDVIDSQGHFSLLEGLDIIYQIVHGLSAAHRQKVVHRDLKPENVYLVTYRSKFPFVKLIDFGIAKFFGELEQSKLTRGVVGSPLYLSPEQCKNAPVDHRADIYSLGILTYELLTGSFPYSTFQEDDEHSPSILEIISSHLTSEPLPISSLSSQIPSSLDPVLFKALAKDPSERFDTIEEFWEEIRTSLKELNLPKLSEELLFLPGNSKRTSLALEETLDGDFGLSGRRQTYTPPRDGVPPSPFQSSPPSDKNSPLAPIDSFLELPTPAEELPISESVSSDSSDASSVTSGSSGSTGVSGEGSADSAAPESSPSFVGSTSSEVSVSSGGEFISKAPGALGDSGSSVSSGGESMSKAPGPLDEVEISEERKSSVGRESSDGFEGSLLAEISEERNSSVGRESSDSFEGSLLAEEQGGRRSKKVIFGGVFVLLFGGLVFLGLYLFGGSKKGGEVGVNSSDLSSDSGRRRPESRGRLSGEGEKTGPSEEAGDSGGGSEVNSDGRNLKAGLLAVRAKKGAGIHPVISANSGAKGRLLLKEVASGDKVGGKNSEGGRARSGKDGSLAEKGAGRSVRGRGKSRRVRNSAGDKKYRSLRGKAAVGLGGRRGEKVRRRRNVGSVGVGSGAGRKSLSGGGAVGSGPGAGLRRLCGTVSAGSGVLFVKLVRPRGYKLSLRALKCGGCKLKRRSAGGFCLFFRGSGTIQLRASSLGYLPCIFGISGVRFGTVKLYLKPEEVDSIADEYYSCAKVEK